MSQIIIEDGGMKAIMADPKLEAARRKLSFHEIRLIMQHAREDLHERAAHYEATITELSEKLDAFQAVPAASEVGETRVRDAAAALIADIRRRYPGEELRCEYMRELDAALNASGEE